MVDDLLDTEHEETEHPAQDDHHPNRVMTLPSGVPVSYQESEVAELAAALVDLGVRPEDRVLIVMPDGAGFAEAVIATILQAAIPLPVNPSVRASVLAAVAADTGARLMVVAAECGAVPRRLRAARSAPVQGPRGTWATVLLLGE